MYQELKSQLRESDAAKRQTWAKRIIENRISIQSLCSLLEEKYEIALRFQWLISDIGKNNTDYLLKELPYLFELRKKMSRKDFDEALMTYCSIAGIPEPNESETMAIAFNLLLSNKTNSTIKSRIINVLLKIERKYPDLRNELKVSLEDQLDKNTKSFKKKAVKTLLLLD